MITLSFWLFAIGFFGYLAAFILYGAGLIAAGSGAGGRLAQAQRWAYPITVLAALIHAGAITARGLGAGHWPTSNMFEFISFMAFTTILAFLVVDRIYRFPYLGALVTPIAVVLLGYASVFPKDVKPLVPALNSYWLYLHVSMAALGEGFFAVAFGASLLYLLRTRGDGESRLGGVALEGIFWGIITVTTYTLLANALRSTGNAWAFVNSDQVYHLPPLIGPTGTQPGEAGSLLGMTLPLVASPDWVKGKDLNTLLLSVMAGSLIYAALRALLRASLRERLGRLVRGLDAELLDEIGYRAVAFGYPIFTLGGLVFAMIWAKVAWGRFWFWDPKETWAFISWLVYSGYLHLRINRGWEGRPSAWTAALGFGVILFTLIGVNLLIVGLHSYVGGD